MSAEQIDREGISFQKPDGLTLREQGVGDVMILRLNHPEIRMELNIMVGDILALAAMATETKVEYHRPEGSAGPLTDDEKRLIGGLFLGAVEADTRLEGGELSVLRDIQGVNEGELHYVERVFLLSAMPVVKHVAMVFGPGANSAIVGYITNHAHMEQVEGWKDAVLGSLRLK